MVILLALLLVLIFAGLGFTLHVLWIVAGVLLVLWLIGFVLGRGEGAGRHGFYAASSLVATDGRLQRMVALQRHGRNSSWRIRLVRVGAVCVTVRWTDRGSGRCRFR